MDNVKNITYAVCCGVIDSLRGAYVLFHVDNEINQKTRSRLSPTKNPSSNQKSKKGSITDLDESRVLLRVFQCCALNGGVFLTSILAFYCLLLPLVEIILTWAHIDSFWIWIRVLLSFLFEIAWVMPLFMLSKVVNGLWFQDIADWSYRYSSGGCRPRAPHGVSRLVADTLASLVVEALFLVQAQLVGQLPIPIISDLLSLLHTALLYSLYAFEYKWCNMGWALHARLAYIEQNWPYFLGFGLPLALLTHLPSSWVVSGCVFSVLFPFFIIGGNEAKPVENNTILLALRLFSPVIAVSNALFTRTVSQSQTKRYSSSNKNS